MKQTSHWLALLATAVLAVGCAQQKEPATRAVAEVEATVNAVRADAEKYASTELQQVESAVASLKEQLNKKDYKGALAAAPAVATQAAALQQTVADKKREMEAAMAAAQEQWRSLSSDVPQMVAAIQSRVDMLSQSRKLPKNLTPETLQSAKDGLQVMRTTWDEAAASFSAGDPVQAVSKAQTVKDKGAEVMQLLGMKTSSG